LFAAGDTVFIQNLGAGLCTVTAGTATVSTAGSLILPQYDAGILYFTSASTAIFYDYIQTGATSPLTTKGDLYTFGTSDTRLAVGANGTTLVADSAQATGLKWAAASSGMTLISTTTYTAVSAVNLDNVFSSTYTNYQFIFSHTASANASGNVKLRNGGSNISTGNYAAILLGNSAGITTFTSNNVSEFIGLANVASGAYYWGSFCISDVFTTSPTYAYGAYASRTSGSQMGSIHTGVWQQDNTSTIDGFSINIGSGTITGTVSVYGLAK
jgi:hypothetical protein